MNEKKLITKLLNWWNENQRKFPWRDLKEENPWIVLGTATLLWKTKAEAVAKIYNDFFSKFPNEKTFLQSPEERIKNLIKPTGLYNRKYLMLKKLAILLDTGSFNFQDLSGFGQYIRNLGRLVLYGEDIVPIDAPVLRLLNRLCSFKIKNIRELTPSERKFLASLVRALPPTVPKKNLYWALVDLADLICLPKKPHCERCPFKVECNFHKEKQKRNPLNKDNMERPGKKEIPRLGLTQAHDGKNYKSSPRTNG